MRSARPGRSAARADGRRPPWSLGAPLDDALVLVGLAVGRCGGGGRSSAPAVGRRLRARPLALQVLVIAVTAMAATLAGRGAGRQGHVRVDPRPAGAAGGHRRQRHRGGAGRAAAGRSPRPGQRARSRHLSERLAVGRATPRHVRRCRPSWPRWPSSSPRPGAASTRPASGSGPWRPPAASWWRGCRTTCAPRSRASGPWSRRSRTGWSTTPATVDRYLRTIRQRGRPPRPAGRRPVRAEPHPGRRAGPRPPAGRPRRPGVRRHRGHGRWRPTPVACVLEGALRRAGARGGCVDPRPGPGDPQPARQRHPPHPTGRSGAGRGHHRGRPTPCSSVRDSCGGIPADEIDRVFDLAFRGDAARTPGDGGGGFGLAIARGLVEAHQGDIAWPTSTAGAGSPSASRSDLTVSGRPDRRGSAQVGEDPAHVPHGAGRAPHGAGHLRAALAGPVGHVDLGDPPAGPPARSTISSGQPNRRSARPRSSRSWRRAARIGPMSRSSRPVRRPTCQARYRLARRACGGQAPRLGDRGHPGPGRPLRPPPGRPPAAGRPGPSSRRRP